MQTELRTNPKTAPDNETRMLRVEAALARAPSCTDAPGFRTAAPRGSVLRWFPSSRSSLTLKAGCALVRICSQRPGNCRPHLGVCLCLSALAFPVPGFCSVLSDPSWGPLRTQAIGSPSHARQNTGSGQMPLVTGVLGAPEALWARNAMHPELSRNAGPLLGGPGCEDSMRKPVCTRTHTLEYCSAETKGE